MEPADEITTLIQIDHLKRRLEEVTRKLRQRKEDVDESLGEHVSDVPEEAAVIAER